MFQHFFWCLTEITNFTHAPICTFRNCGLPGYLSQDTEVDVNFLQEKNIFSANRHSSRKCFLWNLSMFLWGTYLLINTEVLCTFMGYSMIFLHVDTEWSNYSTCHIHHLKPWSFLFWGVVKIFSSGHFKISNNWLHDALECQTESHYQTVLWAHSTTLLFLQSPTLPRPGLYLYNSCSVPVTMPGALQLVRQAGDTVFFPSFLVPEASDDGLPTYLLLSDKECLKKCQI